MDSKVVKQIKDIYYDPEQGFVGIDKIYRKLKEKGIKATRNQISEVIKKQEVLSEN
jgi:hypothetical protein